MKWLPPIATASVKHGLIFLLLERSARLAHLEVHARSSAHEAAPAEHAAETV
jgi:hypothetical protein